jgi:two-component system, LytTR family, sensor kinase
MKKKSQFFAALWFIYLILNLILNYIRDGKSIHFWAWVLSYVLMTGLVLSLARVVLPKYFEKQKYIYLFASILLSYTLYVIISYLIEGVFEIQYYKIPNEYLSLKNYFLPSLKYFLLYSLIGFGYYLGLSSDRKEIENLSLEKEKLQMEMAFLRAQINPHFFFNTLNSVVMRLRKIDFETGELVATMGEVMRYSIQKPEPDGMVSLKSEIEHIENLIFIYKIRFKEDTHISFEYPDIPSSIRIVPLMLVTLVENALKHGEFTDFNKPISLKLFLRKGELQFDTHNWRRDGQKDPGESVGLENINRRLNILYPGKHIFICDESNTTYKTHLILKI